MSLFYILTLKILEMVAETIKNKEIKFYFSERNNSISHINPPCTMQAGVITQKTLQWRSVKLRPNTSDTQQILIFIHAVPHCSTRRQYTEKSHTFLSFQKFTTIMK